MKKILLLAFLLILQLPMMAQNCLTITKAGGEKISVAFADKPVLTFDGTNIVISTDKTELQLDMTVGLQFAFEELPTSVVSPNSGKPGILSIKENTVVLADTKPDMTVHIYGMEGKVLLSTKTDAEGSATFSIEDLPVGTYIVKSETITFKILKR